MPATSTNQRMLATIMFTDVVGYSALMQEDEANTLAKATRDMELITSLCSAHGGRVIKSTGDGLLMHFPAAVNAVECAMEVQHRLGHPGEGHLQHRIGLHLGDVFMSEDDMVGDGVNIAARVMAHADPGGICFSQTVYDVVKNAVSLKATYLGARELKNIRESVPVYQIILAAAERKAARSAGTSSQRESAEAGEQRQSNFARRGPVIAAVGFAAAVMICLLGWWLGSKPDQKGSGPLSGSVALPSHNPVTLGSGAYQRIGFNLPNVTPLKDEMPTLYIPNTVSNIADMRITRLHYCLQDRPGASLPRKVDLWVPAPDSTINVVAAADAPAGLKGVQPSRRLGDGVYCIHDGALGASTPPAYSSVFLIRGYTRPSVAKTEVSAGGGQGMLKITIANAGDGTFDEGVAFVTLQRKDPNRPVFSGRWQKNIPAVSGHGMVTMEFPVEARDNVPGEYYCFGWIGYPYAMDSAMALDEFQSASFSLNGTKP